MLKKIIAMVAFCLLNVSLFAQTGEVLNLQDAIALYEDDDATRPYGAGDDESPDFRIHRIIDVIKELVVKDIDAVDDYYLRSSSLLYASMYGYREIVKSLIEVGANVNKGNNFNETALMYAASRGDTEIVKTLIKAGADINTQVNSRQDNSRMGETALMWAARSGNTEVVKVLIEVGANLDTKASYYGDDSGYTALMWAAVNGKTEVVNVLIEAGAAFDTKAGYSGDDTYTALVLAVREGHTETVKALIEVGSEVNVDTVTPFTKKNGWPGHKSDYTPLMQASRSGYIEIVKLLIEAGADINAKDSEGNTALMEATDEGHTGIAALLEKDWTISQEIGKTYRTTDNLRLRKNGSTIGKPLFTIPKGTWVKILARGNVETIDNITASWVRVEVPENTVSIQGDTIKKGAVGWCFGGYLREL